jgi:hypothetical protein
VRNVGFDSTVFVVESKIDNHLWGHVLEFATHLLGDPYVAGRILDTWHFCGITRPLGWPLSVIFVVQCPAGASFRETQVSSELGGVQGGRQESAAVCSRHAFDRIESLFGNGGDHGDWSDVEGLLMRAKVDGQW